MAKNVSRISSCISNSVFLFSIDLFVITNDPWLYLVSVYSLTTCFSSHLTLSISLSVKVTAIWACEYVFGITLAKFEFVRLKYTPGILWRTSIDLSSRFTEPGYIFMFNDESICQPYSSFVSGPKISESTSIR